MLKLNGGGICDHEVGTGKTLIMCVAAYEMHRLGLAKKPLIIGLKANVHEIAETFRTAYPDARLLYPGKEDFTPETASASSMTSRTTTGTASFSRTTSSASCRNLRRCSRRFSRPNSTTWRRVWKHWSGMAMKFQKRMRSGLEKAKENLAAKLAKLEDDLLRNKDDVVDFRQMGIDHIFVDESHNFKNLTFNTRHARVSGARKSRRQSEGDEPAHGPARYSVPHGPGPRGDVPVGYDRQQFAYGTLPALQISPAPGAGKTGHHLFRRLGCRIRPQNHRVRVLCNQRNRPEGAVPILHQRPRTGGLYAEIPITARRRRRGAPPAPNTELVNIPMTPAQEAFIPKAGAIRRKRRCHVARPGAAQQ